MWNEIVIYVYLFILPERVPPPKYITMKKV